MQIELDVGKSIEENAAGYFEKAKKAKRKLLGLRKAIEETKKRILAMQESLPEEKTFAEKKKRKQQWFEQFHWFFSSDGFLVIAGKNSNSNEAIVKKHLDEHDFFLHADIHGAGACVVKAEGKDAPVSTLKEAAMFAAVFSRAWKQGIASIDVYAVKSNQVSKKAPSGESLGAGAFMIHGKRQWFRKTGMNFAVGVKKDAFGYKIVSGPEQAIKNQSLVIVKITQGKNDAPATAKAVIALLEKKVGRTGIKVDEAVRMLPGSSMQAGNS